jgi:hypothetical protein
VAGAGRATAANGAATSLPSAAGRKARAMSAVPPMASTAARADTRSPLPPGMRHAETSLAMAPFERPPLAAPVPPARPAAAAATAADPAARAAQAGGSDSKATRARVLPFRLHSRSEGRTSSKHLSISRQSFS